MNVRPLRDRILVKRVEEEEQRVGGIIIPDTAKEKPQQGRVVAVGKGRINGSESSRASASRRRWGCKRRRSRSKLTLGDAPPGMGDD